MSHWDVVWICFALTVGVFIVDFWGAHRAARQLRERLLLESGETPASQQEHKVDGRRQGFEGATK